MTCTFPAVLLVVIRAPWPKGKGLTARAGATWPLLVPTTPTDRGRRGHKAPAPCNTPSKRTSADRTGRPHWPATALATETHLPSLAPYRSRRHKPYGSTPTVPCRALLVVVTPTRSVTQARV